MMQCAGGEGSSLERSVQYGAVVVKELLAGREPL